MRLLDLLQAPEELEHVRPDDVPELLGELASWEARIRMMMEHSNGNGAAIGLLTAVEVAEMLHVKTFFIEDEARRGKIKKCKLGRKVRFRPADVAAYIETL